MVDWLAGKRVRGTSSERTPLGTSLGGTGVGGWVEVGRTTLDSNGDIITVSGLPDKRYYKFILRTHPADGNTDDIKLSFNGDSSSNYAYRRSTGGAADQTFTSTNNFRIDAANGAYDRHVFGYVANYASKEKLVIAHDVIGQTAGATTAPYRIETVGKWANTSNAISSFTFTNQGTGNFASGSEAIILGWDPDDTHTNNFWEELASVNTTSGDNLSSGTFTAKKYLWVQMYMKYTSTGGTLHETFNNDTGNNYASRDSYDGGTDGTSTSFTHIDWDRGQQDTYWFINQFIINNASNEKLCIGHQIRIDNTHTGAGTAPHRSERVDKWANTSNQITEIDFDNTTAGIDISNGWLKVWGSD